MRAFLLSIFLFVLCSYSFVFAAENNESLIELNDEAFLAYEAGNDSALFYTERFLNAAKGTNSVFEINAYTLLGIINKDRGFYVSALNNYIKALNTAEAIGDKGRVSACLNNIGSIYQLQKKFERAKEFFLRSLALEDSLNQPLQKSIRYYNLGDVYKEQDSLEIALVYFNNSLRIEQKLKNNEGLIYALLGISEVYIAFDRATDATLELDKVAQFIAAEATEEQIMFDYLKGKLSFVQGELDRSIKFYNRALKLGREKNFRIHDEKVLLGLIDVYRKQKDFQSLASVYEAFIILTEELNSINIKNQLEDLTYQNELNKKEIEISMIKEERDLAKKNEKLKQDINVYSSRIIWFLVLAIVGIFAFVFYTVKAISRK